jgi:hypothetical protein
MVFRSLIADPEPKRKKEDRPHVEGYLKEQGIYIESGPTKELVLHYINPNGAAYWNDLEAGDLDARAIWGMIAAAHKRPAEEAALLALERQKALRDARLPLSFIKSAAHSCCVVGPERPVQEVFRAERFHTTDYVIRYRDMCADRVFALKCAKTGDDKGWATRAFGRPTWNQRYTNAKTFGEAIFYMKLAGGFVDPHEDVAPNDPRIAAGLLHPNDLEAHVKWLNGELEKKADGRPMYSFVQEVYSRSPPRIDPSERAVVDHLFASHPPASTDRSILAYGLPGFGNFNDVLDGKADLDALIGQTRMVGDNGLLHLDSRGPSVGGQYAMFYVHVAPRTPWLWSPMGVNDYCIVLSPSVELKVVACERINGALCIELLTS